MPLYAALALMVALLLPVACANRHAPPSDLDQRYMETPGRHSERPGPHSTTTGRHGTTGTVGGGVDAQSGSQGMDDEAVDERFNEEGGYDQLDHPMPGVPLDKNAPGAPGAR